MTSTTAGLTRVWKPPHQLDLNSTLSALPAAHPDPCLRCTPHGDWLIAHHTPHGPALLHLHEQPRHGVVHAVAYGPGAQHSLDGVPALCGHHDSPDGFVPLPQHRKLVDAHRSFPHWRIPRTGRVFDALTVAALNQVVTGHEAATAWRLLIDQFGQPAPAVPPHHPGHGMKLPPTPAAWLRIPQHAWLRAGVDLSRRSLIQEAARRASALDRTATWEDNQRVDLALRSLRGLGVWTSAEIRQRAHGHPDAFSFYDFHVAKDVTWALTGTVGDDATCEELLTPYVGHRYRVQRLLALAHHTRPRRAPRMPYPTHLPIAYRRPASTWSARPIRTGQ